MTVEISILIFSSQRALKKTWLETSRGCRALRSARTRAGWEHFSKEMKSFEEVFQPQKKGSTHINMSSIYDHAVKLKISFLSLDWAWVYMVLLEAASIIPYVPSIFNFNFFVATLRYLFWFFSIQLLFKNITWLFISTFIFSPLLSLLL